MQIENNGSYDENKPTDSNDHDGPNTNQTSGHVVVGTSGNGSDPQDGTNPSGGGDTDSNGSSGSSGDTGSGRDSAAGNGKGDDGPSNGDFNKGTSNITSSSNHVDEEQLGAAVGLLRETRDEIRRMRELLQGYMPLLTLPPADSNAIPFLPSFELLSQAEEVQSQMQLLMDQFSENGVVQATPLGYSLPVGEPESHALPAPPELADWSLPQYDPDFMSIITQGSSDWDNFFLTTADEYTIAMSQQPQESIATEWHS
ncbi:hypothetical protein AB5N19_09272 [Seiridium cardinale]|uniref:Uncharacterized protein n=1 Tax=Seiridium cardinale TaxID=138064 RepID=A0ABR2Y873_9PEZI